jgi:hypothetical protein
VGQGAIDRHHEVGIEAVLVGLHVEDEHTLGAFGLAHRHPCVMADG